MSFVCPKKIEFVATVTSKEKPQEPKDEQKNKEDKNKDDVKTSSFTNANVFMSMGVSSVAGVGVVMLWKRKKKK